MNIHQLSVTYLAEQDRILLRVNTTASQEMRLWLTRRLMLGLWPLLSRWLTGQQDTVVGAASKPDADNAELQKMLTDFRKEEFMQQADFNTPYRANGPVLPLGDEPLLVTDVQATPLPDGRLRVAFNERPAGGGGSDGVAAAGAASMAGASPAAVRSFQLEMESRLMQGMKHLLEQALVQSCWREAFAAPAAADDVTDAAAGEPLRPRYLN